MEGCVVRRRGRLTDCSAWPSTSFPPIHSLYVSRLMVEGGNEHGWQDGKGVRCLGERRWAPRDWRGSDGAWRTGTEILGGKLGFDDVRGILLDGGGFVEICAFVVEKVLLDLKNLMLMLSSDVYDREQK